jgi:hypothetical protein
MEGWPHERFVCRERNTRFVEVSPFAIQRLFTWSGIVGVVVFFVGFVFAGFIPPPSPSLTPTAVAAHYVEHANGVRFGMVLTLISGMFVMPMVGVISAQIRRIEGISSAVVYAQISAGAVGTVFFFLGAVAFLTAAYRPERAIELTYVLNDFSWIMAVITWPPACMQCLIIGIAVLSDPGRPPVFPRWVGFLNFWVAIGFVPSGLLPFFKSGPFAWNGLLVFWLAGSVFGAWFIAMTVVLLKAIRQEETATKL